MSRVTHRCNLQLLAVPPVLGPSPVYRGDRTMARTPIWRTTLVDVASTLKTSVVHLRHKDLYIEDFAPRWVELPVLETLTLEGDAGGHEKTNGAPGTAENTQTLPRRTLPARPSGNGLFKATPRTSPGIVHLRLRNVKPPIRHSRLHDPPVAGRESGRDRGRRGHVPCYSALCDSRARPGPTNIRSFVIARLYDDVDAHACEGRCSRRHQGHNIASAGGSRHRRRSSGKMERCR